MASNMPSHRIESLRLNIKKQLLCPSTRHPEKFQMNESGFPVVDNRRRSPRDVMDRQKLVQIKKARRSSAMA